MGEQVIGGVEDEAEPDWGEAGETIAGEGFVVDEQAEGELDGGAEVLEQAESGEADASGAVGEEQEWDGGDEAGAEEEQVVGGIDTAEGGGSVELAPEEEADGEG